MPSDRRGVLDLMAASLGWWSDERFDTIFAWKHDHNPFGRSPAWVAVDDHKVVGFRTFMRWEHVAAGGEVIRTVRAVDTVTHPSHQGRGVFRRLTLRALDDLRSQGIAFVFNTPNDMSRPGYLKMGWKAVGRLGASVRVVTPASVARLARARVPADLLSVPSAGGRPAPDVLADSGLAALLYSVDEAPRLRTHRTPEYLRWRYGLPALAYRAVTLSDDVREGLAIFRLRRRGPALECVLCDLLVPAGERRAHRALIRSVVRQCGGDYVIRLGGPMLDRSGFVRALAQGPLLTRYSFAQDLPGGRLDDWALTLGDVELF